MSDEEITPGEQDSSEEEQQPSAEQGEQPEEPRSSIVITPEDIAKRVEKAKAQAPPLQPSKPAQQSQAPEKTSQHIQSRGEKLAGFWIRLAAKIIDCSLALMGLIIIYGLSLLFHLVDALQWRTQESFSGQLWDEFYVWLYDLSSQRVFVAFLLVYALGSILTHAARGASAGKAICGIRVQPPDDSGNRIVFFAGRFIVAICSLMLLGIGHIMVAFRSDKRSLHDLATGGRVVKRR